MEHSPFGPSGAHRWMECPASVPRSLSLPDTTNAAAATGTAAHTILELCLKEGGKPERLLGTQLVKLNPEIASLPEMEGAHVDQTMVDGVQAALDYIIPRAAVEGVTLTAEEKVHIVSVEGAIAECYGHLDVTLAEEFGTLEVVDFKNGYREVEPEGNKQLMSYLVGKMETGIFTRFVGTIIQPNGSGETVKSHEFTLEELLAHKEAMRAAMLLASMDDPPAVPGAPQCDYCPAVYHCPEMKEKMAEAALVDFDVVAVDQAAPPVPTDVAYLSRVLQAAPMVEAYLKEASAMAVRLIQTGTAVPGFKMVRKVTHRRWKDEKKADGALQRIGVVAKDRHKKKLISPAQAAKLMKAAAIPDDKAAKLLKRHVEKPEGAPTLVSESDGRDALTAGEEFDKIE